ncbi:TonB-dependent receptor [Fibrella aquatilis]|uniref:TonB-dependent receptor n=1 Tax=Fibrella aquatilis TaxID=2817059 RepID=A0A939JZY3_9BACT|nr:TonB-dependent receptor [Fibrella aquatilis]MBO0930670.1 TonB-dependent receptor [Fibrella aquatilis]
MAQHIRFIASLIALSLCLPTLLSAHDNPLRTLRAAAVNNDDDDGQHGSVKGHVVTQDGRPAAFVTILVKGTDPSTRTKGTTTAEDGSYQLRHLPVGEHTLVVSFVGLQTLEQAITIQPGQTTQLDLTLQETARQLDEVQVRGYKSANQVPVSVGKVAIKPMDLPQSVAVIDRDVLDRQQTLRLSDVLMNTNGVYVMGTTGGYQEEIAARGFAFNSSNTFKNGARYNNSAMPEISSLERVEVLKGSSAILFGNVAAGGILNLVTKKPRFDGGGQVAMRVGSFGFYKPSFDVYGGITQHVAFRLNGTYENSRSFRDEVNGERIYVNPSLLIKLGNRTEFLLEADYLKDNRTLDFGIGAINYAIPDLPRNRFLGTSWGYIRTEQASSTATLTHRLTDAWQVRATGSVQRFNNDLFGTNRPNASNQLIKTNGDWVRGLQRTGINETYWIGQVDFTGNVSTGRIKHTLLLGADADQYRTNTTAYNPLAVYDTVNVFNPAKFRLRQDIPTLTTRQLTEAPINRAGVYVQDLVALSEQWKLLAGMRWSYQQTSSTVTTLADKKATTATTFDDAFTPRLGLVYQPRQTTALFVSYANSFAVNTGVDIAGNALPPSFINQYEAGIKNDLFNGFLSANATVYQIRNSNLAQTSLQNGNTNTNIKELAGEVTSRGLEIDVKSKTMQGISFLAGYSYNETRYTQSNTFVVGSLLRYNPNHTANASVFYTVQRMGFGKGVQLGLTAFYMGERVAGRSTRVTVANDAYRLIPLPAYTQLNASVGYVKTRYAIRASATNLLNALSYNVHDDNSINPIAPRQVSATLSWNW